MTAMSTTEIVDDVAAAHIQGLRTAIREQGVKLDATIRRMKVLEERMDRFDAS